MENQENTQAENVQPSQPELTVVDLSNLRAIVDVAVRRGAFGAGEVAGVGAVFEKLNNFLNAVAPQKTDDATNQQ